MKSMLYAYWGAVGDHNRDIPGHPLYQLYTIEALAKQFGIQKVYFYSFLKDKVENSVQDVKFFIREKERKEIIDTLQIEVVSFSRALQISQDADMVVLKARFRNKSRLQEASYDALKFEKLKESAPAEKVYVIDSDGELPKTFFETNPQTKILTYFQNHNFYTETDQSLVTTILPALSSRFDSSEFRDIQQKPIDMFFIGNEGLKAPELSGYLQKLANDESKFDIRVQGKWSPKYDFVVHPRNNRDLAYTEFEQSLSTLQVSKTKYKEFSFLSPRVYEGMICGVVPFIEAGYEYSTAFTKISGYIDLREKLKTLREGYARDYKLIFEEQKERLKSVEEVVLNKALKRTKTCR